MKRQIVTFLLNDKDLETLDRLADDLPVSRSNYIRIIIKKYLKEIGESNGTN